MLLSFVIPCYRSSLTIETVVEEINTTLEEQSNFLYEIILVNDCSPDNTLDVIKKLCEENINVKAINMSKNFGQHSALMAGYRHAKGDIVISLDDDGQAPVDEVFKLIDEIQNGFDVVMGRYPQKKHNIFRNLGTKINELMARFILDKRKDLYISSFFAAKKFIIDYVVKYENPYPYVFGLILRTTKNICNVDVNHRERTSGESGYTFSKLLSLWLNGFTAFSVKPLRVSTVIGLFCSIIGFSFGGYIVIRKLIYPLIPAGYSSVMAVILFIGGILMIMLGIIGEYIGRIYISLNDSPQYVIKNKVNFNDLKSKVGTENEA
ncbi:MAG: glycosyl transferase family [Bacillales bacterium]|jgi:undecaprenyl-phosphate 4-deoxy-4-formamido-L-arabinose transferase|nr:glycosyl transferase family [Bacillales bacterium]